MEFRSCEWAVWFFWGKMQGLWSWLTNTTKAASGCWSNSWYLISRLLKLQFKHVLLFCPWNLTQKGILTWILKTSKICFLYFTPVIAYFVAAPISRKGQWEWSTGFQRYSGQAYPHGKWKLRPKNDNEKWFYVVLNLKRIYPKLC